MKLFPAGTNTLIFLLLFCFTANAQILRSKEAILSDFKNYSTGGIDNKGNEYLSSDEELPGINGGTVTRTTILYFLKGPNNIEVCSHSKIITPSTEAPIYIAWLDEKMIQETADRWRDPESHYIYMIDTEEPFFLMYIFYVGEDGIMPTKTYKFKPSNYYTIQVEKINGL